MNHCVQLCLVKGTGSQGLLLAESGLQPVCRHPVKLCVTMDGSRRGLKFMYL